MENRKAILISIVCFVISILLVKAFITVRENELTKDFGQWVDVVVAEGSYFEKNHFIPEYAILTPSMLSVKRVFSNFRQPNTVTEIKDIVGKATFVPILQGEQITLTKLVHQDGRPVLDKQVERSMRAVTIMISPESGVSRLIRPGNRVDVMIAPPYEQSNDVIVEVKTLFQNITVLATGKHIMNEVPTRVDKELVEYIETANAKIKRKDLVGASLDPLQTARPDDNYSFVTLQLSAEDAQKIVYITHRYGDRILYLTLRNTNDNTVERVPTTLLEDVLGKDSDFARSKPVPAPPIPSPAPKYYDYIGDTKVPRYK